MSDNRGDLPKARARTLILQCSDDIIASGKVGEDVHRHIADSTLARFNATGHCPNRSAPGDVIAATRAFI